MIYNFCVQTDLARLYMSAHLTRSAKKCIVPFLSLTSKKQLNKLMNFYLSTKD